MEPTKGAAKVISRFLELRIWNGDMVGFRKFGFSIPFPLREVYVF